MSSPRNRIILISLLAVFAAYLVAPTIVYFSMPKDVRNDAEALTSKLPSWLPQKHIKLGLDLQGGVQLVLGVDTDVAISNKLGRVGTEITRWANDGGKKKVKSAYVVKGTKILRIEFEPDADLGQFKVDLADEFQGLEELDREGPRIDFGYDDDQLKQIKSAALNQAEIVVRNRVDKWGVTEPSISRRVDGSILVQLPGFKDPSKARELLGRTAQLQFKLLNEESKAFQALTSNLPEGVSYKGAGNYNSVSFMSEDKNAILEHTKGKIPEGSELLFEVEPIAGGKKNLYTSHLLFAATELSGEDVLDATLTYDSSSLDNRPAVSLKFTGQGGKRFGDITGENIQKRMAIVLDGTVVSDPVIQARIASGNAQITLGSGKGYNEQIAEAQDLALILKSGALPAPITILEQREVGATLGPELADQGVMSVATGLVMVLVFMFIYYKRPGVLSCLALTLNGLFLLAGMASFGFALTLPGFAGFILTLGMAVDANILINERIRQELKEGRNAKKAVETAFKKVFWTIIDANVTTLIAALVLLETNSSGPIKGFSVTLILGLLVSMFTSLYCTRAFFRAAVSGDKTDKAIRNWLGGLGGDRKLSTWDFLSVGRPAMLLGVVIAIAVLAVGGTKGVNWSVDFAGGTEIEMAFNKPTSTKKIREVLKGVGIDTPTLQTVGEGDTRYLIRFEKALEDQKEGVREGLLTGLKETEPQIMRVDFVGPLIGSELRTQGMMSILWSVLFILLYIGLRFDMRFGPGAVLKMVQDVFIILGFYVFFQRSFDLTSVAALLTVIGYSVNDTIVIYDRIRENLVANPRRSLYENINFSINETLARTINTSLTTIIALAGVLIFASAQIWNFAAAMALGVISASLSSTFISSYLLLMMDKWRSGRLARTKAAA